MNKNYCIRCNKYTKLKNPEISYIFSKTVVSVICDKWGSKHKRKRKRIKKKRINWNIENSGLINNLDEYQKDI